MNLPTNDIRKIGILRALQLGDLLCSVPAFRVLRHAFPEAEICLIGLPWCMSFVRRFKDYIDRFVEFPGYPGLPERVYQPLTVVNFIKQMQEEKFDLFIQLQGNGTYVNPLTELFAAKNLAGYYRTEDYCPDQNLFMLYPNFGSEIKRHLLLMEHLGLQAGSTDLEFPMTDADFAEFVDISQVIPAINYVCVHPGSRGSWRRWPASYFAQISDYCYEQGFQIVLTGTAEEKSLTNEVENLMKHPAINSAGLTSLGAMGVLVSKASMLISNCTGVSHMASALEIPSIVISMDGEPERWAPLNTSIHKITNWLETPDFKEVMNNVSILICRLQK
ncbi:glycosyltransferase family 9 protein [Flavihumibacter sp. R14]|nr:glycosyltransferase family 9 protein [Flavihumibacter soli]